MDSAPKETERLKALNNLNILDTEKEPRFDRITKLASHLFSLPFSGLSFRDDKRVWFKSVQGLQIQEVVKNEFFLPEFKDGDIFIVEDAYEDGRFKDLAIVKEGPKLRFYAAVPITTPDGYIAGELFVSDRISRKFSSLERDFLKDLSFWVNSELYQNLKLNKFQEDGKALQEQLIAKNRELEEEKALYNAMLGNIGDGVIGVNDRGEIIFVNDPVYDMTGFSQVELIGKPLWFSLKTLGKDSLEVPVNKTPIRNALYQNKKIVSNDYFFLKKDGTKFPVAMTATPVIAYQAVIGGVVVFRDISKEKEVDRMKTEFISLASHQLRTPLSAMKWFAELLLDDSQNLTEEQRGLLENIYQSNERMIELVNALLNISRIESGRIIIEPKPTELGKLVNEVIQELQPKIGEKNQNLAISVHQQLPIVNLDPKLIRHVYMNLLTNAIKYTPPEGEIVVMISRSGDDVVSQVSDNGYGIPQRQQGQVFSKFFRADNILKVETDGTGLGLYLTKAIVESSGGKIWFKSDERKGTTFWLSLPIKGIPPKKGEVSIDT